MTATATIATFGSLANGTPVQAVTLANGRGVSARILSFGATLQSLVAPAADGTPADVVLGHDDLAGYEAHRGYIGSTIGRYANRIAHGAFTLDGVAYSVDCNNGPNSLHGGTHGFDRANWSVEHMAGGDKAAVTFRHVSTDGEGGFPGEIVATVRYALDAAGRLEIRHEARTTRPTIINMTNHALFNLAGGDAPDDALGHHLTVSARAYLPVDADLIPTGEVRDVRGSVFDFTAPRPIGERIRDGSEPQLVFGQGYDHNFVLDKGLTSEPGLVARLEHPASGRVLEVWSTEPGLQLYSGNQFDGTVRGKGNRLYRMGDGIALEPQRFPDTPNRPAFGSARLDPGDTYRHVMAYCLSARG